MGVYSCCNNPNRRDVYWHQDRKGKLHGKVHKNCYDQFMDTNPLIQKECPVCHDVIRKGIDFDAFSELELLAMSAAMQIFPIVAHIYYALGVDPVGMRSYALTTGGAAATVALAVGANRWHVFRMGALTFTGAVLVYGALTGVALAMK